MGSIIQMNPKPKLVGDLDFVAIEAGRDWKTQQKETQEYAYTEPKAAPSQRDILSAVPKIVSISATGNCSIAISSNGHVYAWGCNDVGNLGVPKPDPSSLTFSEPGLPLPKTSTLRQFHTHSFDSSHNVALPLRLDAVSDLMVTAVSVSPTFLWCIGTKRTDAQKRNVVGRTLYEVQEAKRYESLRSSRNARQSDGGITSTIPFAAPFAAAAINNALSPQDRTASMDPPEVIGGSQVEMEGEGDFEEGSTSRHSQGIAGNALQSNLSNEEKGESNKLPPLPPRSPTKPNKLPPLVPKGSPKPVFTEAGYLDTYTPNPMKSKRRISFKSVKKLASSVRRVSLGKTVEPENGNGDKEAVTVDKAAKPKNHRTSFPGFRRSEKDVDISEVANDDKAAKPKARRSSFGNMKRLKLPL
jgi:hypothetical protein